LAKEGAQKAIDTAVSVAHDVK